MAFNIPANLAPETYPMAWLVDSWVGGGVLEYGNIDAAAYLHELTIDNEDGGPYLRVNSHVWLANEPANVVDKEAPGVQTYQQLTKERLWSARTGFLRVNPEAQQKEGTSALEAMMAAPSGTSELWVGVIQGPRLQLITDSIVRSASGAKLNGARLLGGYVESELFYAYDMEAFGFPMSSYMAGRLGRRAELEENA